MHSRALRIVLVAACIGGVVAAAAYIRTFERNLAARRAVLRDVDARAREAHDALGDLRVAQQAYLAFGQGTEFWTGKVDATVTRVTGALAVLQPAVTTPAARTALDAAVASMAEFANVDERIRGYLKTGAQLMAADIVFTEGGDAAVAAGRHIEEARLDEHVALDRAEADTRQQQIVLAGAATGFVLLVALLLAVVPARKKPEIETSSGFLHVAPGDLPIEGQHPPADPGDGLSLRPQETAPPAPDPHAHAAASLRAAAQICTEISRVGDSDQLKALLSRAAEVLDASGLMLWLGSASGAELRPALAHGYSAEIIARIPAVSRHANNAAAAAFRSGTLQVVLAKPGSTAKGAVVAPVLSSDGCVGVLSAEIRNGGEADELTQSLAAIFAAQLAGVVAPSSNAAAGDTAAAGAPAQRATGGGA